jgi:glutamine amidotransferase-like uncharacterized protein
VPGGRDLPYKKKLKGIGNQHIQNYVREGGIYIGFCAGAYYGCSSIEFDKGGQYEIVEPRELSLFSGLGVGPLIPYEYNSRRGARVMEFQTPQKHTCKSYYNGGCAFVLPKDVDQSSVQVMGVYGEKYQNKPAIVWSRYGKGQVLLSGLHIEYHPDVLERDTFFERSWHYILSMLSGDTQSNTSAIISDLRDSQSTRDEFIKMLFRKLGL